MCDCGYVRRLHQLRAALSTLFRKLPPALSSPSSSSLEFTLKTFLNKLRL
jgi:hypothetical protein